MDKTNKIAVCNRCGNLVFPSALTGYTYECKHCYEDLYTIEVTEYNLEQCKELRKQFLALCEAEHWSETNRRNRLRSYAHKHKMSTRAMIRILRAACERTQDKYKRWIDLTPDERSAFIEAFYRLWKAAGFGAPDTGDDNPNPWGMPWLYDPEDSALAAEEYYAFCEAEIAELFGVAD